MAFGLRGTPTTGGAADGANFSINMPTGIAEGDWAYVFTFVSDQSTGATISDGSWEAYVPVFDDGVSCRGGLYRKKMGASPDASVTVAGSGNTGDSGAAVCYAFQEADATDPEDGTPTTTFNGSGSTNPDCPSHDTATNGSIVLAVAGSRVNDASVTVPTGYSNLAVSAINDATDDATAMGATIVKATAGTENPPAFTNVSSGRWVAITVSIKAAAAATGKPTHFMHYQKLRRAA